MMRKAPWKDPQRQKREQRTQQNITDGRNERPRGLTGSDGFTNRLQPGFR